MSVKPPSKVNNKVNSKVNKRKAASKPGDTERLKQIIFETKCEKQKEAWQKILDRVEAKK